MIPARPRTYRGVRFRSTLEADWAATLDALGVTWQYEPEAYILTDGSAYSPDFWLPAQRTWLEVKGPHNERHEKYAAFVDAVHKANEETEGRSPITTDEDHPDLIQVLLARAAQHGSAHIEDGCIIHCAYCGHYSLARRTSYWCRVCWRLGGTGYAEDILFVRARDDDPPRAG